MARAATRVATIAGIAAAARIAGIAAAVSALIVAIFAATHAEALIDAKTAAGGSHGEGRHSDGQKRILGHWIPPKFSPTKAANETTPRGYLGALSAERIGRIEKIVKIGPT